MLWNGYRGCGARLRDPRSDRSEGVQVDAARDDCDRQSRSSLRHEIVSRGFGQADGRVGFTEEVPLALLEVSEHRPVQRIAEVPRAAVDPLVGPQAAHVEQEADTVPALQPQADQGRDVAAAMDEVERALAMQPLGKGAHPADVEHRR